MNAVEIVQLAASNQGYMYRGADKSLAIRTSRCILFDS